MQVRTVSFLIGGLLTLALGCKKTDEPVIDPGGTPNTTPTSMVGTWKATALTFSPAWAKPDNGKTVTYTDYMQYLKAINETCLTDVVWTFTDKGALSTNMSSVPTCSVNTSASTLVVNFLVEPRATYAETARQVQINGTDNVTGLTVNKTFATGNLVSLQWKEDRDMSNNNIPTTYTLTLKKQ